MKKWLISGVVAVVALILGAVGMNMYNEHQGEKFERQYESSVARSYSESIAKSSSTSSAVSSSGAAGTTTSVALPSEQEVVDRLKGELDKFIADQKDGIIKTGSAEDIRDAFEDTYVETYQNELEAKFPGEANEDQIESLIDLGLLTLNFDEKIAAAK